MELAENEKEKAELGKKPESARIRLRPQEDAEVQQT